ncbi:hypothetical protein QBC34DRAFT_498468 [Podospora aff. communis PSN243]|uniref:XPG-I domain-containing protein n=1 Tax=Podospora aff. communis PSN243 TaxID=3040156 RepID=A0AAV9G750_9PEZI|nr:hypothetical protein QBC34DRAFT_498468 [Podospora aff. communis PSN243]
MLLNIPTIALAALSLSSMASAYVTWLVNYDTNKPTAAENCAELRIVDTGVNGGALTIADWVCNGREHNGDRQWTFDYAGKFNWYSATIHQSSFYYIDGFGITYRTDHGTFYWNTGRMDFKGNGFYSKEGCISSPQERVNCPQCAFLKPNIRHPPISARHRDARIGSNHDNQWACLFFRWEPSVAPVTDLFLGRLWDHIRKATPGRFVSLATLADECSQTNKRPLRIAIDAPLTVFAIRAAIEKVNDDLKKHNGREEISGMNHIVRDFYFQILHLLSAGVEPIFVFDGCEKPTEKGIAHPANIQSFNQIPSVDHSEDDSPDDNGRVRDNATRQSENQLSNVLPLCRLLLKCLGLPYHDALAESEAECVELERLGNVDAILTRDGDTFVFGGRTVLRKERAISQNAMATQFKMEDLENAIPGLRQQDLFLLAMLSGGDYDRGIPGCGVRISLEIIRHPKVFARELDAILTNAALNKECPNTVQERTTTWKKKLADELMYNTAGGFSAKWADVANAINTNAKFPSPKIARYYREQIVSSKLDTLEIPWTNEVDFSGLRRFAKKVFDWRFKFYSGNQATPGMLEVKIIPYNIVRIDYSDETIDPGYKSNLKDYADFKKEQAEWVPKWIVEYGAPGAFRAWEAAQGHKAKLTATQVGVKRPRGRPRKDVHAVGDEDEDGIENPPPKRPRGRPGKGVRAVGHEGKIEDPVPKRPRGRPRKEVTATKKTSPPRTPVMKRDEPQAPSKRKGRVLFKPFAVYFSSDSENDLLVGSQKLPERPQRRNTGTQLEAIDLTGDTDDDFMTDLQVRSKHSESPRLSRWNSSLPSPVSE